MLFASSDMLKLLNTLCFVPGYLKLILFTSIIVVFLFLLLLIIHISTLWRLRS